MANGNLVVLTLAEIEAYDPDPRNSKGWLRYHCPVCRTQEKSIGYNPDNGKFVCHRSSCHATGTVKERWPNREPFKPMKLKDRARANIERRFSVEPVRKAPALSQEAQDAAAAKAAEDAAEVAQMYTGAIALVGTPGAAYVATRGIAPEFADMAGTRFYVDPKNSRRQAVIFPVLNPQGELVAVQRRRMDGGLPKSPTTGPKSLGAFLAPCGDFGALDSRLPCLIVTEGPFDALAIAYAGYPALAMMGSTPPVWLAARASGRKVLIATDNDAGGDAAADNLAATLRKYGARPVMALPPVGKDWNETLLAIGRDAVADIFAGLALA